MTLRARQRQPQLVGDFDLWAVELKQGRWKRRVGELLSWIGEVAQRDGLVIVGGPGGSWYCTSVARTGPRE
jgi:hypothetical protein